jgi:dUTP pyrophosphatase
MKIKIVNKSRNSLPEYSTVFAAGMDLRADLEKDIVLMPMQRKLVNTGIYVEIPEGYEAQIRPRSGLAIKHGITVLNSPGTIDSDYRGEVCAIMINLSDVEFTIRNGDRICQMIISKHEKADWEEVEELKHSDRDKGGFGHTGSK